MASVDLRAELECSLCLNIYGDPVNLTCGHNFCRVCIDRALDIQEGAKGYSCPECRKEFQERPVLYRNITLCKIVQNFLPTQPDKEESGVFCTQCVDSPVPAVKSCLLCEASLCDKHLKVHSKSPEHVLCDPTTTPENRKCSVHKKLLEYYCSVDGACICLACRLDGTHDGHQVKMLADASEMKKNKLKSVQEKLMTKQKEVTKRIYSVQKHKKKVIEKAKGEKTRITVLLGNLRRRLEDLEKRVLGEISGQAERVSSSVNHLIRQLEIEEDNLSRKMGRIEELCNLTDPLTVLQESDTGDLCDTEDRDEDRLDGPLHDVGDLDVAGISRTLHTGLSDIMSGVNEGIEDIWLDTTTAGSKLQISCDGKMVTALPSPGRNLPKTPKRFAFSQVMSSWCFSSGQHYWDVDVEGSDSWDVGMCYPSVDKSWNPELCYRDNKCDRREYNNKYWCLNMHSGCYYTLHGAMKVMMQHGQRWKDKIRIYVDYEAGQISFYCLMVPITHIHTFTTTFTEPLHAVIGVWGDYGYIKICGGEETTRNKKSAQRLVTSHKGGIGLEKY